MRLILPATLLLASLFITPARARNSKEKIPFKPEHYIRAGVGIPFHTSGLLKTDWKVSINGFPISPDKGDENADKGKRSEVHKSPSFTLGYYFRPRRWVEFGANLYYYKETGTKRYALLPGMNHEFKKQMWGLVAETRFFWLNSRYVDLYSSLAFGMGILPESRKYDTYSYQSTDVTLLLKYSLFGISVGNKVYGFAELSGVKSGCQMGIGYRF
ncbi:MAG: hypothetical protein RR202_10995 [Bacteroidales bacterium]